MEALIVVLLLVIIAIVAGAAAYGLLLRGNQEKPENLEPEEFANALASLKNDLTQAVTASQQTMLGQVNALDRKINQRLDAVRPALANRSLPQRRRSARSANSSVG